MAADRREGADHATLHQGPEAFDGLSMDGAANVLAASMVYDAMGKFTPKMFVTNPFIRAEQAHFVEDAFADESFEGGRANIRNDASDDVALAPHGIGNDGLAGTAGPAFTAAPLVLVPVRGEATDESLIYFNNAHKLVELLVSQSSADAVAHVPSGAVRAKTHHAVDFEGGNSFLAGQHEADDAEPLAQGLVGVFKNGACNVQKAVAALAAIRALPFPLHRRQIIDARRATTRAMHAIWPTMGDRIGRACILGRERLSHSVKVVCVIVLACLARVRDVVLFDRRQYEALNPSSKA
jgi:hypothetical protein